jgi:hypothetical protein
VRRLPACLLVAVAVAVGGCGGKGEQPPATGSAGIVPDNALVYLHLSTDPGRAAVKDALALGRRFPSFPLLRAAVFGRLRIGDEPVDFDRDIRPWLGDEAALALLDTGGRTAGSLLVFAVKDRARARAFLARAPRGGRVTTAFVRDHLVIGPAADVRRAIDAAAGRIDALDDNPVFRRAQKGIPGARFADGYVSRDGVDRLLRPQGGLLGVVATLLANPALQGSAIALTAQDPGLRLWAHTALGRTAGSSGFQPFHPELLGAVPKDAIAYLGVKGLTRAAAPLLAAAGPVGGLAPLLRRLRADLARRTGVNLARDVLPLLSGEVALAITPQVPAAMLTLIARAPDERRAQRAFARLETSVARLFVPRGGGASPTFQARPLGGGVIAHVLSLGQGAELDYAIFDGRLVVSTSLDGIRAVRAGGSSLSDAESFKATLGSRQDRVTSLVFLDFNQLLTLAEQTGLNDSQVYARVRDDLHKIQAVGAQTTGGGDDSTAELRFQIP